MTELIVTIDLKALGGTPVFCSTRVPIAVLFEDVGYGLTPGELLDSYPTLSRKVVLRPFNQAEILLGEYGRAQQRLIHGGDK